MKRLSAASQGFRPVPRTGVIYVMTEAAKRGYSAHDPAWSNLGQGAPETYELDGAPSRITSLDFTLDDLEYAPVDGLPELRDAVAELYNQRYRQGKKSQYSRENVAIGPGGRAGLTRVVSTLGRTNIGHFLPDYTAYEELLDSFESFVSIPILLDPDRDYEFTVEELRREILGRGLSTILLSNPCNPTGKLIHGNKLQAWIETCREVNCAVILDEFYSHYVFVNGGKISVSGAEFVEDVNDDPVIIIDGLTKNWRYPGFRVSWTIGPKQVIEAVASAGSFLDGGCARPMQLAALQLVKKEVADAEAKAIQNAFRKKRRLMLEKLELMGIVVDPPPLGAFYCWGDLQNLPPEINTGMKLFEKALEKNVIIVPGSFFDINPGQRRADRPSRFRHFARFSFGPSEDEVTRGLELLNETITDAK